MSYVLLLFVALLPQLALMYSSGSELYMVPAMASKALPCRSRAPEVSLDHLVQSIEVGLGTHRLMQISKGVAPLVGGLDIFCQSNKIPYAILEMNQDLLTSLTKVDASGIWENTQLQHAF